MLNYYCNTEELLLVKIFSSHILEKFIKSNVWKKLTPIIEIRMFYIYTLPNILINHLATVFVLYRLSYNFTSVVFSTHSDEKNIIIQNLQKQ